MKENKQTQPEQTAIPASDSGNKQPAQENKISLNPAELIKSVNPADLLKAANPADLLKVAPNQPAVKVEEKVWGLVCYIPLMALLALVINPRSEFIKLHGRQGILVTLIFFFNIFVYLVPVIGIFLGMIVHFGALILGLFSAFQAFLGNWWKIPVLGSIADLLPMEAFTQVARDVSMGAKIDEMDKDAKLMENKAETGGNTVVEPPVAGTQVEEKKETK